MRKNIFYTFVGLMGTLFSFGSVATATIIDSSNIQAFGTDWGVPFGMGPDKTIDDNMATYWHGTNDLYMGQTNFLAYQFNNVFDISQIDFYQNWGNMYAMGSVDIQISHNSTTGLDGNWSTIYHIPSNINAPNGDFSVSTNIATTQWIRFVMTYGGEPYGSTPQFLLSEVDFHGSLAAVPEPATMLLFGTGIAGLAGIRIKRRNK